MKVMRGLSISIFVQITPWVVSASTQTLSPVMKVGRTQTAGPILRASASQTLLPRPCKEAESQTMMPFPKQNSFTQTTDIIPVDVLVQTDVLSQLPPFVYTDIAEDSNVRLHELCYNTVS